MEYDDLKVSIGAKDLQQVMGAAAIPFTAFLDAGGDHEETFPFVRVCGEWALGLVSGLSIEGMKSLDDNTARLIEEAINSASKCGQLDPEAFEEALTSTNLDVVEVSREL